MLSDHHPSAVDDTITDFFQDNPGRMLIANYQDIAGGDTLDARDVSRLCDKIQVKYCMMPTIIVVNGDSYPPHAEKDALEDATGSHQHVMIVIATWNVSRDQDDRPDRSIVSIFAKIAATTGCFPEIVRDKLGLINPRDDMLPVTINVTTYYLGRVAAGQISDSPRWIDARIREISGWRIKCVYEDRKHTFHIRRCKACTRTRRVTCIWCSVCSDCSQRILIVH